MAMGGRLTKVPIGATPMGKKRKKPKRLFKQARGNQDYWPQLTNPRSYRYFFHPKHHGGGSPTDARWKPDITQNEEFTIFEIAVRLDLSDESCNLYNVRKAANQTILELGIFHEQIARFWKPSAGEAWHGHPLWPVVTDSPHNRSRQKHRPDGSVFRKLVEQGVLSERDSHRLNSGKNV
jgi:hypothetical protein